MNRSSAFTLVEIMVGLLVSLLLIIAMATFLGNVGYMFQGQKSLLKDRAELQRSLTFIARDMMDIGFQVTDGQISVNGNQQYFVDIVDNGGAAGLNLDLFYYKMTDDMEFLADANNTNAAYNYQLVSYTIDTSFVHPVSGQVTNVLLRNGEPFLIGLSEFDIALGYDMDGSGRIEEIEWQNTEPITADDKILLYGEATQVRITMAKQSTDQDGNVVESRLSREILLRNRGGG